MRPTLPLLLALTACWPSVRPDDASCGDWYADRDGDGAGAGVPLETCSPPPGYVETPGDCDDADPDFSPTLPDLPDDGVDQDCNGVDATACFVDVDRDGWGDGPMVALDGTCDPDDGEVTVTGDCDDLVATVFPGADETADDDIDQDCNGADLISCFVDADDDGWGAAYSYADPSGSCTTYTVPRGGDCDDRSPTVFPTADELLDDGIDQDCNGADTVSCWVDRDGDGFEGGLQPNPDGVCDPIAGEVGTATDCDDTRADVRPGATEVCDGADTDCDALTTEAGTLLIDGTTPGTDLSAALSVATAEIALCAGTWPAGLVIDRALTLVGHDAVLDGGGLGAVLSLTGGPVHLVGLELSGGSGVDGGGLRVETIEPVVLDDVEISANSADVGGGIWAGPGSHLTLRQVRLTDNVAGQQGGGLYAAGTVFASGLELVLDGAPRGGGIFLDTTATAEIRGLRADANSASFDGGAIYTRAIDLLVVGSAFSGQTADRGAALFVEQGLTTLAWASFDDGIARDGGALYADARVIGVGLGMSGNEAYDDGGAIVVGPAGSVDLEQVTLIGNTAGGRGGGMYIEGTADMNDVDVGLGDAFEGGGLYVDGLLLLRTSRVHDDDAERGGGIYVAGTANLTDLGLHDNAALDGAGLYAAPGSSVDIADANLRGNTAGARGGAIFSATELVGDHLEISFNSASDGGGLFVGTGGTIDLATTGIRDNRASRGGAGFVAGALTMSFMDLVRNEAGSGGGLYVQGQLTATDTNWATSPDDNLPDDLWSPGHGSRRWDGSYTIQCDGADGC